MIIKFSSMETKTNPLEIPIHLVVLSFLFTIDDTDKREMIFYNLIVIYIYR